MLALVFLPELLGERCNLATVSGADCLSDLCPVLAKSPNCVHEPGLLVDSPRSTSDLLLLVVVALIGLRTLLGFSLLHSFLRGRWLLESQANLVLSCGLASKVQGCLNVLAFFELIFELFETFFDRIDRLSDFLVYFPLDWFLL